MFISSGSEYEVGVWSFIWDSRQYIFIEQFIFFLFLSVYFLCIMIDKENLQDQQKNPRNILCLLRVLCLFKYLSVVPPTGKNQ